MKFIFHPKAAKDVREIVAKYAAISADLSDRFWDELESAIDSIVTVPERHHYDPVGLRRTNLKKFPYHILFEVRLDGCFIIVVRHHRRNPAYGLRRTR
ncbi:MAG: type II toxin-antitoxin system RelE/ParE family toxin [Verrucomicrobiota bacterium]